MGPLTTYRDYGYIITFVDMYSKYVVPQPFKK